MPDDVTRTAGGPLQAGRSTAPPPAAADVPTSPSDPAALSPAPQMVGRYELLEELARGGMGVVFRARDPQLSRDVAVKLMHEGHRTSPTSVRRFTDEAMITGQLQHPGIPPVHEVGRLPDGSPFLAMKLIRGRTLDELLKDRPDPSHDRGRHVAAFEQVCQAVAYAHAHGVVHRDLKPANVMVGAFGEVQVMDWGLAKVLADGTRPGRPGADPDATLGTEIRSTRDAADATQAGSLLGTPAFMPPEQAIGAVDEIDAQSDVFGLGAVLCAVLTGRPPFVGADAESTRKLAARGKLDDAYARLAGCGADPDLVALCRRCLAAEKASRPADAGAVAQVVAGLRTAAEERARRAEVDRARAEVRAAEERKRRRVQLALGGVGAAALLVGGGLAGWQWWRAEGALGRVTQEQGKTTEALAGKTAALTDASAAVRNTVAALRTLTDQIVAERANRQAALSDRDRAFLRDVRKLWEEFAATRGDTEEARALRAEGVFRVSNLEYQLGQLTDAEAGYRRAMGLYRDLVDDFPANSEYRHGLAGLQANMAVLLRATGRPADAERAFTDAGASYRRLTADVPANPKYRRGLAFTHTSLGILLVGTGRPADAERAFAEARDVWVRLVADFPEIPEYLAGLADTHTNLGVILRETGRAADAVQAHNDALAVRARLASRFPVSPNHRAALVSTHTNLGIVLRDIGRRADAERAFTEARDIQVKLAAEFPASVEYLAKVAETNNNLGTFLWEVERTADAERAFRDALAIQAKLVAGFPDRPDYRAGLARAHYSLGLLFRESGRLAEPSERSPRPGTSR